MKRKNAVLLVIFLIAMIFSFTVNKSFCQVTDKDGNVYQTVTIGTQEWTSVNLYVEHYRNGDVIPQVQDATEWKKLTTGAWCYYEKDTENGKTYGKLYNWYAVSDSRGLAPEGWHVSTDAELTTLAEFLGGKDVAGGKMKSTTLWVNPKGASNESGFTALPGGYCDENGKFKFIEKHGCFWSSTSNNTVAAWCRELHHNITDIKRDTYHKRCGLSVRCVKD
jgi:uncharacterized protein (TIGR02145 family)